MNLRFKPPLASSRATAVGERGFTLLEILVAVAILGVAMVSLLGLQARNLKLVSETQDMTTAAMLAGHRVALIKTGPFPKIGEEEGEFTEEFVLPGFGEDEDESLPGADRFLWKSLVQASFAPTLRDVTVSVWLADDRSRPLVSLRFFMRPTGFQ